MMNKRQRKARRERCIKAWALEKAVLEGRCPLREEMGELCHPYTCKFVDGTVLPLCVEQAIKRYAQ